VEREAKSTNCNYLALSGGSEWSLYQSCPAFGIENPDTIVTVFNITRGCIQLGPKGTDPERCLILVSGRQDNPDAWSLVDYREAVSDTELEARKRALSDLLPSTEVRNVVKVESTQDLVYRERALR